jgi:hypothetical protein
VGLFDGSYAGIYRHRHGIEAAIKEHEEAVKLMGADAPPLYFSASRRSRPKPIRP